MNANGQQPSANNQLDIEVNKTKKQSKLQRIALK